VKMLAPSPPIAFPEQLHRIRDDGACLIWKGLAAMVPRTDQDIVACSPEGLADTAHAAGAHGPDEEMSMRPGGCHRCMDAAEREIARGRP